MSTFAYTAFDSKGKLFRGDIEEKSWTQALRRVKEMGLFPASVKERARPLFRQKVKGQEARTRQNATRGPLPGGRLSAATVTAVYASIGDVDRRGPPADQGIAFDARAGGEQETSCGPRRVDQRNRGRFHTVRNPGETSQGLQPALRE